MKKQLIAAFIGLTLQTAGAGEILFDLQSQYYSRSMAKEEGKDGPMQPGQYDVGKAILMMNLSRWHTGVYSTIDKRRDGYLIVDLKQPVANWTASVNASYRYKDGGRHLDICNDYSYYYNIKLISGGGEQKTIGIDLCRITIENKVYPMSDGEVNLSFFIRSQGDKIKFSVNARELASVPKGDFNDLKLLEMDVGYNSAHGGGYSLVRNVIIGAK